MLFNIYFLSLALLVTVAGCRSPESKHAKQLALFRVHLEVNRDSTGMNEGVPIYRANPIMVNVDREPVIREGNVTEAKVLTDKLGGFALQVRFDQRGTWLLEQITATNPGRRLAIYTEFGVKPAEKRWLAAPVIMRRISDGVLTFTPDATREDTEQIALGLNNVAIKSGNQDKPKKKKSKVE